MSLLVVSFYLIFTITMTIVILQIPSIKLNAGSVAQARHSWITDWIEHLNPSSPAFVPVCMRKRSYAVTPTSGNVITTTPPSSVASRLGQERGQSHLKRPRYDISEDDTPRDPEQITPNPHYKLASSSTAYAFQPTYDREFEVWTGLESTADNGSETSRNFLRPCSNPSSASSSSCDSTTSSQVTWSR